MTNVKLKLMFFLLNALLTADIVHSRPYSDNTTDIVIRFSNNNTFELPIDSNSDTLIVADQEENNDNSNTNMEAILTAETDRDKHLSTKVIKESEKEDREDNNNHPHIVDMVNAEQGRDEDMSVKVFKDNTLNIAMDEATYEKHKANPHIKNIMDAERAREHTITDINSQPDSEFVEMPRFEFLIANKVNESDSSNRTVKNNGVSDNNLDKSDKNSSDLLKKVDYVELVEVLKMSKGENKSAYNLANITGHEVDNDLAPDTRFTDMQTLLLACAGTLLPLLLALFATLLIRCMCRRWCPGFCKKDSDISESDSSEKQDANHQQLKSPTDESASREGLENGEGVPANGSIFTMTLKNNHLIVETEERNDITKNGRETKMKYSPDNDGIFVVEVQQSTAYRPNKSLQSSPPHDPQISTNQALIHRVPEELDKKPIEDESERSDENFHKGKTLALSSTGLSISDLSMSSTGSHNVSYSYGSQVGYEQGRFGYPIYTGYDVSRGDYSDGIIHDNSQEPLIGKTPTDPYKPVVTAAIFKQDSIIGNDILQGPGYCIEGSTDGPLLSDVQAREYSLQHLHEQREKKLENGVAVPITEKIETPKKTLNRADSLPVRLEENTQASVEKNAVMETIAEDPKDFEIPSKDALKGKRASLPIIRTDAYESVKDVVRRSGSPKFGELVNDKSSGDNVLESPPMITITEDCESGKSDGTS